MTCLVRAKPRQPIILQRTRTETPLTDYWLPDLLRQQMTEIGREYLPPGNILSEALRSGRRLLRPINDEVSRHEAGD